MHRLASFFLLFILLLNSVKAQENLSLPPPNQPIPVECGFFLVNLTSIDEKNEVFSADVYFTLSWNDPRLSFQGTSENDVKIYTDENVLDQFKEMWRPQIEFMNTGQPIFTNRSLFIHPNGLVEYRFRITADFRSKLNFEDFPFDQQRLEIQIDSFLWNKNILYFVPSEFNNLGFEFHNDEKIVSINVKTGETTGLRLKKFGDSDQYSTVIATIIVERKSIFFLYQIFLPLFLILGISCTVFFSKPGNYTNNVTISLTAFLVFLAAKFTINLDLPRVGYMTVIDRVFLVAYLVIGFSVVICTLVELWGENKKNHWTNRLNFHARWVMPLIFIVFCIYFFVF